MFQTLKVLPGHILGMEGELFGVLAIGVAGLAWLAVPFLDDARGEGPRARFWTLVGAVAVIYIVVFTVLAFRGPTP